jgi:hypothetical protein
MSNNRNKRFLKIAIFAVCVSVSRTAPALPSQTLVRSGEWVYDALAILSREQQRVFFADSSLTVEQIERLLAELDKETLSPSGKIIYEQVEAYLRSSAQISLESDALAVGIDAVFQPEFYFKTNPAANWIYDYHRRNPLFLTSISLSLGSFIALEFDPYFGQNEYAATQHDNRVNIPLDPVTQTDLHYPKWAYLSAGLPLGRFSGIHFAIGIGNDFLGRTDTGSIILSEYMERVNYAQLSIYSPLLKYTMETMQLQALKYQYMHYLHVRPYKTVSVTLTEGLIVNAPLELRYLNPLMIFHGYEAYKTYDDYNDDLANQTAPVDSTGTSRVGSFFGAKIEFQPFKYLRLYGLFAMDQLQLGIERDNWPDDLTPDALAFQAGTEVSIPVHHGYWAFSLEGVYTYPYMYVLYDKGWSFYKELDEFDKMTIRYWTGTPFGPDSIAGALSFGHYALYPNGKSQWSLKFSFLFLAQGERSDPAIFDTNDYRPSHEVADVVVPPTGTPMYTYTANLLGTWAPFDWLHIAIQPGYRVISNHQHTTGKLEHGFEIALSLRIEPNFGSSGLNKNINSVK